MSAYVCMILNDSPSRKRLHHIELPSHGRRDDHRKTSTWCTGSWWLPREKEKESEEENEKGEGRDEKREKEKENSGCFSHCCCGYRNVTHFFNLISTMITTMTIMTVTAKAAVILSITMATIATIFTVNSNRAKSNFN